jgi:predicted metal-dependent hydrolase
MDRNQLYIKYGSKNITFYLSYSIRKTLRIVVLPSGEVLVMAPMQAEITEINEKVKSKASWIIKQQAFFGKYKPNTPPRKFVNGETHLYLGRQYKLQIEKSEIDEVKIKRGELIDIFPVNWLNYCCF